MGRWKRGDGKICSVGRVTVQIIYIMDILGYKIAHSQDSVQEFKMRMETITVCFNFCSFLVQVTAWMHMEMWRVGLPRE